MQFYLIPAANGLHSELAGTKPDAKAAMKARGLKGQPEDYAHDVPTSKAELMAYVNELLAKQPSPGFDIVKSEDVPPPQPISQADAPPVRTVRGITTREGVARLYGEGAVEALEEFILDYATVAQVENLFARLGTRFAELRKGG